MASFGASTVTLQTGNLPRLTVDSSGNVGIGTASPQDALHIAVPSAVLRLEDTDTNHISTIQSTAAALVLSADATNAVASSYLGLSVDGSERARIDSSGRLLVGTTTTSAAPLTVNGTVEANTSLYRAVFGNGYLDGDTGEVSGGNSAEVQIQSATSNRPAILSLGGGQGSGEALGAISFFNSNNTDGKRLRASIICGQEGATANQQGGLLTFSTTADGASSPTENMRIASNRNVRFGTTATSYGVFDINNDGSSTYKLDYISSSGSRLFAVQASNGTVVNSSGAYTTVSDVKLKENIVESPSQWQDIKALRVVKYNFKEETGYDQHTQLGLIAQEVEEVSPGLVFHIPDTDPDGVDLETVTKGVKQSIIYMKAVKALQEAMERIETLEQRLTDAGIA